MRKRSFPLRARRTGFVLITVLLLLSVVVLIAAAVGARTNLTLTSSAAREKALRADYAARAGLHRTLARLARDPDWETGGTPFSESLPNQAELSFEAEVINNRTGTIPKDIPGKPSVPAKRVWIRTIGLIEGQPLGGRAGQAESLAIRPEPIFNFVIRDGLDPIGGDSTDLNNCTVDSYDSTVGYVDYLAGGGPPRGEAKIWVQGDYNITDGARIDADLASEKPVVEAEIVRGAVHYGQRYPSVAEDAPLIFRMPREFDDVAPTTPPGSGLLPAARYGSLNSTGPVVLEGGVYFFDNLTLNDGHSLSLDSSVTDTNPCQLYLGGVFSLGAPAGTGVLVNMAGSMQPNPPRHLQIYCTGEVQWPVVMGQNAQLSGVIAGYKAAVTSLSPAPGHLFGAFHGIDFYPGFGSGTHYDVNLRNVLLDGIPEWVLINEEDDEAR